MFRSKPIQAWWTPMILLAALVLLAGCTELQATPASAPVSPSASPTATLQVVSYSEDIQGEFFWGNADGSEEKWGVNNKPYPIPWRARIGDQVYLRVKLTNQSPHAVYIAGIGFSKGQIGQSFFEGFILDHAEPQPYEGAIRLKLSDSAWQLIAPADFIQRQFVFQTPDEQAPILPVGQERSFKFYLVAKQAGEWDTHLYLVAVTNRENFSPIESIRVIVLP